MPRFLLPSNSNMALRIGQLNCNRSSLVKANLIDKILPDLDICLLQEPNTVRKRLGNYGRGFQMIGWSDGDTRPRAAIVARSSLPLWFAPQFSNRDTATAILQHNLSLIHI